MKDENLQPEQEPKKDESKSIQGARKQNARVFLWVVCALYLLYLVSKLLKDLFAGAVETQNTRIMVIAASIAFTAVAVYLLVISIRHAITSFKDSVNAMAEEDAAEAQQLPPVPEEDAEEEAEDEDSSV